MIHNSSFRIFSGHPIRDRVGAYSERAEKRIGGAKKTFWERANPKIDRICAGLWSLKEKEEEMGRRAVAFRERGLDRLAFLVGKALAAEEKAEKIIRETAESHAAKGRAIAEIFTFWRTGREKEGFQQVPPFPKDGEGLPRPPREKGVILQDARGWYGGRECGGPRYPAMTGTSAVHLFNATQVRRPQEE